MFRHNLFPSLSVSIFVHIPRVCVVDVQCKPVAVSLSVRSQAVFSGSVFLILLHGGSTQKLLFSFSVSPYSCSNYCLLVLLIQWMSKNPGNNKLLTDYYGIGNGLAKAIRYCRFLRLRGLLGLLPCHVTGM